MSVKCTRSDASGVDRLVPVFLYMHGAWRYTYTTVPDEFVLEFLPRRDNQIEMMEMLAPLLALGTWPDAFVQVAWTAYVDNQGVLHSMLKGSSLTDDLNSVVGAMWHHSAASQTCLFVERVESKANMVDGPTRHDFSAAVRLAADFCSPQWPIWACKLWQSEPFATDSPTI